MLLVILLLHLGGFDTGWGKEGELRDRGKGGKANKVSVL